MSRTVIKAVAMSGNGSANIADFDSDVVLLVDAHDPAITQSEDVEDLALERLASHLGDARAAGAQHDLIIGAGELEPIDVAALLEPPAEGIDHLLAAVANPLRA